MIPNLKGVGLRTSVTKIPYKIDFFSKKMRKYEKKMCIKGGKKCKTRPNNASYNCENIMKKQILGSWEGLKREKLVQKLNFSRAIMSQKSQF